MYFCNFLVTQFLTIQNVPVFSPQFERDDMMNMILFEEQNSTELFSFIIFAAKRFV